MSESEEQTAAISRAGRPLVPPGAARPPGFGRRAAALTLLGAAALLAGVLTLRGMLPPFELPGTSLKLATVGEAPVDAPYDLLFLGSSRTWHAFDPEVFEAGLRGSGHAVNAFNFGVEGMWGVGSWQVLERLAEDPPPGLRWVLIDPEALYKIVRDRQPLATGTISWHTPRVTELLCRMVWRLDRPVAFRLEAISRHLHSCLYNVGNIGLGAERIARALGTARPADPARILGPARNGFIAFPDRHASDFAPGGPAQDKFVRRAGGMRHRGKDRGELTPEGRQLFEMLAEAARALGARPVFVTNPSLNPQRQLQDAFHQGIVDDLLPFDHPGVHPELYTLAVHYDSGYLNAEGAALFSERLAEAFASLLDGEGGTR